MRKLLMLAAIGEGATGLALLTVPSFVAVLLLGDGLSGIAVPVARVAGIALVGLSVACWPGRAGLGMLIYSSGVALYLAYLGIAEGLAGVLLWPAVAVHVVLSLFLGRAALDDAG